ncbi:MAG TPA: tetratricopeptide repeat protein [Gemmataceae bacterium]
MSERSTFNSDRDSAEQQPSFNEPTINEAPDASQDIALKAPSHIDATVDTAPDASSDFALDQPSHNDATVDAPPSDFQEPGLDSHMDVTVDAPPSALQDAGFELGSHLDATVDAPPSTPDQNSLTMDHLPTEERDGAGVDGAAKSVKVETKAKNRIANYEILGVLGRGAVGVVYKARQIGLNRLVALKMLLAGSHAGQRELMRFRVEAEAVARLRHPNIVQVYEVGEHNGLPFFSLEFVEGGSLHGKMEGKPLTPQSAAKIMVALCQAMHFAHEHNIIHRDLKPANILLTPDGVPKITDFGLAKRLEENEESSQTKTGTLMGTPSYMSPEQAEGRTHDIGPLSDQYTLGAILYELLTGRPPFLGATLLETIQQVRNQEPVPPTQLQATTPKDLEIICLKGLQKDAKKRYRHAGEMADDLQRFLNHEPIHARPVSRTERVWRWCRRNPRVAALYAAVALLVMLVLVSGGVLGFRMMREQQTVAQVGVQAEERLKLATDAITVGNVKEAGNFLHGSDPLLDSATGLDELRGRWHDLKDRVEAFGEFKDLLDQARFALFFGDRNSKQMDQGRENCQKLLALYDARGLEADGLPPLNDEQKQLFKEEVFDMYLVAARTESELTKDAEPAVRQKVARQALDWLDRADKILPGMRTLYANRAELHKTLGDEQASQADEKRALSMKWEAAVDNLWHANAEIVKRGDKARLKGDWIEAQKHYREAVVSCAAVLRQHPEHFWAYFWWAIAKVQLGEFQDALIGFTECIRLKPQFAWSYNNRGTAHLNLRQYNRAIGDYSTALEKKPDYFEARAWRAHAYLEQGDLDKALNDCNQVLEQNSRYAPAFLTRAECYKRRKQYDQSLADYTQALDVNENKVEVYLKRAAVYQEMNRFDDALGDYDRAVKLEPNSIAALRSRAFMHYLRKEYQKSVEDFTSAIALDPQGADLYTNRAIINWGFVKDLDAAIFDWEQVLRLRPNDVDARRSLGGIYLGRRQYTLALRELEDTLKRRPDYPEALGAKAQIYLWQGKAMEALDVINPLVQKLPPGTEDWLNVRGDIYRALGQLDEAAADYRRLIQLKPKLAELCEAYVSLALVYSKQGKPDQARQCLDELVKANPQAMEVYLRRGRFLRDQGQFEEAHKDAEQAARCDAKSVLPALLRASIRAAQGDTDAALTEAERAMIEAPQNDGQVIYSAVQVWSLASAAAARAGKMDLARRHADRAAEYLAQALEKGYSDLLYSEHTRMSDDPALEAIRQHPKARDLIAHRGHEDRFR